MEFLIIEFCLFMPKLSYNIHSWWRKKHNKPQTDLSVRDKAIREYKEKKRKRCSNKLGKNYKYYKKINKIKPTLEARSLFMHCSGLADHYVGVSISRIRVGLNKTTMLAIKYSRKNSIYALQGAHISKCPYVAGEPQKSGNEGNTGETGRNWVSFLLPKYS